MSSEVEQEIVIPRIKIIFLEKSVNSLPIEWLLKLKSDVKKSETHFIIYV